MLKEAYTTDQWQQKFNNLSPDGGCFINGKQMAIGQEIILKRPMDGSDKPAIHHGNENDVNLAVQAARESFADNRWRGLPANQKKKVLLDWASLIKKNINELALLETLDTGKPITESITCDISHLIECINFYAELADKINDEVIPTASSDVAIIKREPLGVIAAITPWNYPSIINGWKMAPALLMGNSFVLKPAELASFAAIRIAQLAVQAGLPEGVLNVVTGYGHEVGKYLAMHNDVDMIAFTGSTAVGHSIVDYAAKSNLKRTALELGGKSALVVFPDADLDAAANDIAWGVAYNCGQSCHAPSRLVAHKDIIDTVIDKIERVMKDMIIDNPLNPTSQIGPLISSQHQNNVTNTLTQAQKDGGELLFGGKPCNIQSGGYFMAPGVLKTSKDSSFAMEELFGPVIAAISFESEDEAVSIANSTKYGLGGAVYTNDMQLAHRVSDKILAGIVWINSYDRMNMATPFGGFKQSGNGRDKSSHAIDKYVDLKTIWQHYK